MKLISRLIRSAMLIRDHKISVLLFIIISFSLISQSIGCSVWTDKSSYNPGDPVIFNYQLNVNCNAELTVIRQDGAKFDLFSGSATAGTHQIPGTASEPCGTRTVIFKVSCDGSGGGQHPIYLSDSGSSGSCQAECTFNVICPPPTPTPSGCTETYQCNNNVVQRLCYENGIANWKDYDNCNNHKQPCDCINGVCIEKTPPPPQKTCDQQAQQACMSQNGPVGQPYANNGAQYQRYMDCNCEDGSCQCNQVERQVACSGVISGGVIEGGGMPLADVPVSIQSGSVEWSGVTDSNGAFRSSQGFCPSTDYEATAQKQDYTPNKVDGVTDVNGNAVATIPITAESLGDVKFMGEILRGGTDEGAQIISFYHFAVKVNKILEDPKNRLTVGSTVGVSSSRSGPAKVDSVKNGDSVEVYGKCLIQSKVSTTYSSYNANVGLSDSLSDGAQYYLTKLRPKCSGTISGHVSNINTKSPIPGATLLICQEGGNCWSSAPSDLTGLYGSGEQACPSTSYEITCSAEGYRSSSLTITTDVKGNSWQDFQLEPENKCMGTISGDVINSQNNKPIEGASLLICQGDNCWSPASTDAKGHFSSRGMSCPSIGTKITISAEGYKPAAETLTPGADGNSLDMLFTLVPDCQGTISGNVLDASNSQPVAGANLLICQFGNCLDPIVTDSSGKFLAKGFCPSTEFDITCSAENYKPHKDTASTSDKGNSVREIRLESESKYKDIRFEGTFYRGVADMGFTVYYFKVDKVLEGGQDIPIGDPVGVDIYTSSKPLGQGGSADALQEGDRAEVYAHINTDKGKWNDGHETAWPASITEDKKYYVKKLSQKVENKPDLTITDIEFSEANLVEGDTVDIIATIKNVGDKEGEIDKVKFMCSVNYIYPIASPDEEKDIEIGENTPKEMLIIKPGETKKLSVHWTVVPIYNVKNEHIHAKVFLNIAFGDSESNENNNDLYKSINVQRSVSGCDFDITKDAYSFENVELKADQFELIKGMVPSVYELLDPVTKSKLPIDALSLLLSNMKPKEGVCYGMASTSILCCEKLLSRLDNENTFDLSQDDKDVMGRIFRYQAKQWIIKIIDNNRAKTDPLRPEFDKIVDSIKNRSEPVLLALWDDMGEGHAVVIFDYYEVNNNEKNLVIYDPNYPGIGKIIKMNLDPNKNNFNYEEYVIAKAEDSILIK